MSASGEEPGSPRAQAAPVPRRDDHLLLWVVLMLGLLAASIWWLLNQSWTGATSGVMDRVVVVPERTVETPSTPETATGPEAIAPEVAQPTPAAAGKADATGATRKSSAPRKTVAARTRNARPASRLTRNAHPLADNLPPRYPPGALRSGAEGSVLIRAEIGADGIPTAVTYARRSGNRELDRAALTAVRDWRFQPALRDGKAIASAVQVPVDFVLDERAGR